MTGVGQEADPGLQRSIGFVGLLALSVGINIGAGLFLLANIAGAITGPTLPIAMAIAAVPALLALVPFTMLARGRPTTAATYRYIQLCHPRLAFLVVAAGATAILVGGLPLFAVVVGEYLGALVPVSPLAIGAGSLALFFVVNLFGVRPTVVVQIAMMVALLAALLMFVGMGAFALDPANLRPGLPGGVGGLLAAAGLLYGLLAGGLFIIDVGDEVIDASHLYRRVLPLGLAIVLVLYLAIMVVMVMVVPHTALDGTTLVAVAEVFMGPGLVAGFVLAGAVTAATTTINATYTLVSRVLLVLATERLLPNRLGAVGRHGTPHWALSVVLVVSLAALLLDPPRAFLGAMLNMGIVLSVAAVALSALRVPERRPDIYRASAGDLPVSRLRAACWAVIVMNGLLLLMLTMTAPAAAAGLLVVMGLALLRHHRTTDRRRARSWESMEPPSPAREPGRT